MIMNFVIYVGHHFCFMILGQLLEQFFYDIHVV